MIEVEILPRLVVLVSVQAGAILQLHLVHPHEVADVFRSKFDQRLPDRGFVVDDDAFFWPQAMHGHNLPGRV
ncbi:MAG TPA: hypothetical protein VFU16_09610 [Solirubrobacterales bacterium]|nr:hypothetical protein [Solirubrobacterales bacterium]